MKEKMAEAKEIHRKNLAPKSKSDALKKKMGNGRTASAKDRKKNPYLSSDSKVWS